MWEGLHPAITTRKTGREPGTSLTVRVRETSPDYIRAHESRPVDMIQIDRDLILT